MLQTLDVSTSSLARDKAALPAMLSRDPASLFRLVAFLSSDAIRMPVGQIGPLIRRSASLELLDAIAPIHSLNRVLPQQQNTEKNVLGTTNDKPGIDSGILDLIGGKATQERREQVNKIYEKMTATAWTLRHEIGTKDLGKVVAAYPSVLLLDASQQILPAASYLMNELGIWEDDLPRVLQLYPGLLGTPIYKMQEIIFFLISNGVPEEKIAGIFRSFPALLTLDVEKDMVPVVKFLRKIGIRKIGRFISRLPPILGYSVEKELEPKWRYLKHQYPYEIFEISRFPAYFSYPFERVIKPRFEYLTTVKHLPPRLFPLDSVLRFGNRDFAVKVSSDSDNGEQFAAFLKMRQKINSAQRPQKKGPRQARKTKGMARVRGRQQKERVRI